MYDMSVLTTLSSTLPPQTVFSCVMEIPGTQYSLVKRTMYNGDPDIARARRVSHAVSLCKYKCDPCLIFTISVDVE